jgi:hypothetical protein
MGRDELHVLVGGSAQLGFGANRDLRADGVLQFGIEPLVRVELGAVAGQEEHFDVALALGQPGLHGLAVMHAQVVQHEPARAAQPTRNEFRCGEKVALEDKYLQTAVGTIVCINERTATIDPGGGAKRRVGFALLRHVVDI